MTNPANPAIRLVLLRHSCGSTAAVQTEIPSHKDVPTPAVCPGLCKKTDATWGVVGEVSIRPEPSKKPPNGKGKGDDSVEK